MAELRIKVSEEKVRETIQTLSSKISRMEDHLAQIDTYIEKLEKGYDTPAAKIAMEAFKKRRSEARDATEKFKVQRDKLQAYLDTMNATDARVSATYQEALNKTNQLFN